MGNKNKIIWNTEEHMYQIGSTEYSDKYKTFHNEYYKDIKNKYKTNDFDPYNIENEEVTWNEMSYNKFN